MNTFETYRGPIAYVQAAGYITQETLWSLVLRDIPMIRRPT